MLFMPEAETPPATCTPNHGAGKGNDDGTPKWQNRARTDSRSGSNSGFSISPKFVIFLSIITSPGGVATAVEFSFIGSGERLFLLIGLVDQTTKCFLMVRQSKANDYCNEGP